MDRNTVGDRKERAPLNLQRHETTGIYYTTIFKSPPLLQKQDRRHNRERRNLQMTDDLSWSSFVYVFLVTSRPLGQSKGEIHAPHHQAEWNNFRN